MLLDISFPKACKLAKLKHANFYTERLNILSHRLRDKGYNRTDYDLCPFNDRQYIDWIRKNPCSYTIPLEDFLKSLFFYM